MKKIMITLALCLLAAFAKEIAPETSAPNRLEMVLILDKSGSMSGLEDDTIGGFNSMIDKQKDLNITTKVTTVLFDTKFNVIHDREDIKNVQKLTSNEYRAGGNTALLDAIGSTINKIENVSGIYDKNSRVLFVIITDGQENSSKEYTKAQIKKMISAKQSKHDWEFVFLGANIDAVTEAESLGIKGSNAVKYKNSSEGVRKNFEAAAELSKDITNDKKDSSKWKDKVLKDK
ncbi:vWA domain-containing protein [Campylobacter curvus]|uniref:von Willebrand factor type A (VWA) domain protein n=1 Tax=Campylobacter curvus (strain 525.92) TaxID=360105 RepID=A7H005_CAMC5|nr:vWA domain-containing protein [Campylobacter curvus]EAU01053.1 von Willebrand factor type A (vWA) domain protein [Campylobacter curvus 525.92]